MRTAPLTLLACLLCALTAPRTPAQQPDFRRRIQFSGYEWNVKNSPVRTAPGDNFFSNASESVFVDGRGALHLKLRRAGGAWQAAEVVLARSLGYGTYRFELETRIDALDSNVVAGFFTWSDRPEYSHREIDVEFSRWGAPLAGTNAQYVVQPPREQSMHRFLAAQTGDYSSHRILWEPDAVSFDSRHGHPEEGMPFDLLSPMAPAWTYRGEDVPRAGGERFRMNLYLYRGEAPRDGRDVELVLRSFTFLPR